ncbi:hypothetical protein VTI28DRAFT_10417 [Corynascus sepedonium]
MNASASKFLGQGIPYNAWGPEGQYAPKIKVPTIVSGTSSRTLTTYRQHQSTKQGKSSWAKVPSRKHAPQLPDYLKKDMPIVADDDDDGLDLDSDEDIIRAN